MTENEKRLLEIEPCDQTCASDTNWMKSRIRTLEAEKNQLIYELDKSRQDHCKIIDQLEKDKAKLIGLLSIVKCDPDDVIKHHTKAEQWLKSVWKALEEVKE